MTDKQIPLDGRVIPIEQAIKIGLISEKDINAPSKSKIMYDYNAKDCEQCNPDSVCCYCKNITCYKLEEQLRAKEQECEELDKELHKNFEEKDKLHLIIDRLLEASGYDTNTASAEDFEDVYENMRYEKQQLDQLKAELEVEKNWHKTADEISKANSEYTAKLKQTLADIKEIAEHCIKQDICTTCDNSDKCHIEDEETPTYDVCKLILQKISEVEDEN